MKLEGWSVCLFPDEGNVYRDPAVRVVALQGRVHEHTRFADGQTVVMAVAKVERTTDFCIATSRSGNRYLLGEIDPRYEAAFPNALARLVDESDGLVLGAEL